MHGNRTSGYVGREEFEGMSAVMAEVTPYVFERCGLCNASFKGDPGSETDLRAKIRAHIADDHLQPEPAIWISEPRWQQTNLMQIWIRYGGSGANQQITLRDYLQPDQLQVEAECLYWSDTREFIRSANEIKHSFVTRVSNPTPSVLEFTLSNGGSTRDFQMRMKHLRPDRVRQVSSAFCEFARKTNASSEFLAQCEHFKLSGHENDYVDSLYRFMRWCASKQQSDLDQMNASFEKITHAGLPLQACIEELFMRIRKLGLVNVSGLTNELRPKHPKQYVDALQSCLSNTNL